MSRALLMIGYLGFLEIQIGKKHILQARHFEFNQSVHRSTFFLAGHGRYIRVKTIQIICSILVLLANIIRLQAPLASRIKNESKLILLDLLSFDVCLKKKKKKKKKKEKETTTSVHTSIIKVERKKKHGYSNTLSSYCCDYDILVRQRS